MSYLVQIDARRCKSCELCIRACPKHILIVSDQKNDRGFCVAACADPAACSGCAACAQVCPDVAIEIFEEDDE